VSAKESGQLVTVRPDRYDRRRQRTREAILTAAVDAFRRKGVADTTIGDITQSADIAYRTFYNHFDSLEDVISAVAEMTLARVVDMTDELLPDDDFLDLIPAVSVRLIMRLLSTDPTVRWMLERPYIFVDEWRKIVTPSMRSFADLDPDLPVFQAIGGVETWIRVFPWILVSELNDAIAKGSSAAHEENLANMSIVLLGVDEARRAAIVDQSRRLVDSVDLQPAPAAGS
jgi:AcrR family transcriptional regulator